MSVIDNIKAFWKDFEQEQKGLLDALNNQNYEKLTEILDTLNSECNEISGAHFFIEDDPEQPELTFDTGPNKTSQLICQQMKKLAPASIKKTWLINDTLTPLSQKAIEAVLQIKDVAYTLMDMTAFYTINPKAQNFEVQVYCPGFSLIDNPEYKREMAIYLIELAVGENCLESYIGSADFLDAPIKDANLCNLCELYDVIMETVQNEKWPEYKHPLDIYTVFKPHQDFASDSLRKDMKMIFTVNPPLIEETLGAKSDVQLDLKAKGGEYGYIYYVNLFDSKEDAALRQKLATQIEALLAPLHYAKVIGGAIGKSYSYIDVVLFDQKMFGQVFAQIQSQLKDKVELHYRSFDQD